MCVCVRVCVCTCVRACVRARVCCCGVLTDEPVNRPSVSDIRAVYCFAFRSGRSELFIWISGIKWNPQLSLNHICIPSVWPCSNSFAESINSHAWTCSHKYTTHCQACIETNLSFLLSHRHKHTFPLLAPTLPTFSSYLILLYSLHIQGYRVPMLCPRSACFRGSNTNSPIHCSVSSSAACNSDQQ